MKIFSFLRKSIDLFALISKADLNLPVTISIGYLQKLTLQVPWKNLYTHPTKATVEGLFLLVVPKTGETSCWLLFSIIEFDCRGCI